MRGEYLYDNILWLKEKGKRALEDSNPRHAVLETAVLPTELRTHLTQNTTGRGGASMRISVAPTTGQRDKMSARPLVERITAFRQ
jgi:hypothetical protein